MARGVFTSEQVISGVFGAPADVSIEVGSGMSGGQLSRWRHFVTSYSLPPLPTPVFVVHLGGKSHVHYKRDGQWSERASIPGTVSIVPAGIETEWLINGELDVATLSIGEGSRTLEGLPPNLSEFIFSFSDPLSVALTRQIISELYQPSDSNRDIYLKSLVGTLQAHVIRDRASISYTAVPQATGDIALMHRITQGMRDEPGRLVQTADLAKLAEMSPAQFCRVFKSVTGEAPKRYAIKVRMDRAKELLEQSDLTAGEIADELGFSNQSHFTRVFRDWVGVPPIEYRATFDRSAKQKS